MAIDIWTTCEWCGEAVASFLVNASDAPKCTPCIKKDHKRWITGKAPLIRRFAQKGDTT